MNMHLYSGAEDCIIVNEGAQPPSSLQSCEPLQFQGRVYDIDFNDAQMQDIHSQIFRQHYASLPRASLVKLLAMLKDATQAA